MDRFEEQLKQLPLRGPSVELKQRIFSEYPREKVFTRMFTRRIPMGWAASFALAAGLLGVTFSNMVSKPVIIEKSLVRYEFVQMPMEASSDERNPYDNSVPVRDWLPDEMDVDIQVVKGSGREVS